MSKELQIKVTYMDDVVILLDYTEYNLQAVRMGYGNGSFKAYTIVKAGA